METCTFATGHVSTTQRQNSVAEQANITERDTTEEELKTMIEERKKFVKEIEKAEDEFAEVTMELPGAFNLLTSTAAERCTSALYETSRFFKKLHRQGGPIRPIRLLHDLERRTDRCYFPHVFLLKRNCSKI